MDIKRKIKQDSYSIMNKFLAPFHNKGILNRGMLISNPFIAGKQKTPSFNIYQSKSGEWRFKDFATGESGDVFALVMQLKGVGFNTAVDLIKSEFNF